MKTAVNCNKGTTSHLLLIKHSKCACLHYNACQAKHSFYSFWIILLCLSVETVLYLGTGFWSSLNNFCRVFKVLRISLRCSAFRVVKPKRDLVVFSGHLHDALPLFYLPLCSIFLSCLGPEIQSFPWRCAGLQAWFQLVLQSSGACARQEPQQHVSFLPSFPQSQATKIALLIAWGEKQGAATIAFTEDDAGCMPLSVMVAEINRARDR